MRPLFLVLLPLAAGCYDPIYGAPLGVDTASPVAFPDDVGAVFQASCSGSTCHAGGGLTQPHLDDYEAVVDQASSVEGLDYIEPGDPDASYLYAKVTGAQAAVGGGGSDMPLSADPLSDDDLATLSTWITDGAPPAE